MLLVRDNQFVRKGDLLVEIDPVDYDVKVNEAAARLEAETPRLPEVQEKVETSKK